MNPAVQVGRPSPSHPTPPWHWDPGAVLGMSAGVGHSAPWASFSQTQSRAGSVYDRLTRTAPTQTGTRLRLLSPPGSPQESSQGSRSPCCSRTTGRRPALPVLPISVQPVPARLVGGSLGTQWHRMAPAGRLSLSPASDLPPSHPSPGTHGHQVSSSSWTTRHEGH